MPYNFAAESFHTKKRVADILPDRHRSISVYEKRSLCVFEPQGGLEATYAVVLGSLESPLESGLPNDN